MHLKTLCHRKLHFTDKMRPDSLLRLWRYINHLLTYLLTYLLAYLLTYLLPYLLNVWCLVFTLVYCTKIVSGSMTHKKGFIHTSLPILYTCIFLCLRLWYVSAEALYFRVVRPWVHACVRSWVSWAEKFVCTIFYKQVDEISPNFGWWCSLANRWID